VGLKNIAHRQFGTKPSRIAPISGIVHDRVRSKYARHYRPDQYYQRRLREQYGCSYPGD
jgi:hypothetical protein